jgi:effector-binding domain-containing protein
VVAKNPAILTTVRPRATAVIAQDTTWSEFPALWPKLLDEVYGFVRRNEHLRTGQEPEAWQNVMLYRDDRPSVEVGVLVAGRFERSGRVVSSELPGGEVAMAVHRGDYTRLGVTHDAVRAFAEAERRELAGPRWEIYGHWREDPSELETEIYWLLR